MSWNNPNGGGGGGSGRGPWSGGGGPGGSGPPDRDELLKRGQEKLRDVL
ncbi:MAG: protease modulator HflK N-terminal domain-containing protein, partial [Proteobacteria bacterium]|nr:protease modulator HflK N-terminal domain-containing protein [Pseudomonadota bacterium]